MADAETLTCSLCFHHCKLTPGAIGFCRTRANLEGQIKSISYGRITSLALDPIEKKPLARFHPGSFILSVGSFGCNLRCPFCQNYTISQAGPEASQLTATPQELADLAEEYHIKNHNLGLAFTYNEPLMNFEFVKATARLLKAKNLIVVLVTNGCLEPKKFRELLPLVDAMNIDLKGFTQEFYDWCHGDLETVKENIQAAYYTGVHVEVTTLVIPGKNDSQEDMNREARWLSLLSPDLPLHLSRYFPRWHCSIPMTPDQTLMALKEEATKYLHFVYLGNW
jgi:pyruvate formate lyase activating enzyme